MEGVAVVDAFGLRMDPPTASTSPRRRSCPSAPNSATLDLLVRNQKKIQQNEQSASASLLLLFRLLLQQQQQQQLLLLLLLVPLRCRQAAARCAATVEGKLPEAVGGGERRDVVAAPLTRVFTTLRRWTTTPSCNSSKSPRTRPFRPRVMEQQQRRRRKRRDSRPEVGRRCFGVIRFGGGSFERAVGFAVPAVHAAEAQDGELYTGRWRRRRWRRCWRSWRRGGARCSWTWGRRGESRAHGGAALRRRPVGRAGRGMMGGTRAPGPLRTSSSAARTAVVPMSCCSRPCPTGRAASARPRPSSPTR